MQTEDFSDLTLYGAYTSRPFRVCWMLKELGLDFKHVPVQPGSVDSSDTGAHAQWYRAINPNARIPTLKDGDFVIWETSAINLYLVQKFGGPMRPDSPEGFGRAVQWAFFMSSDVEPSMVEVRRARFKTAPGDCDMVLLEKAQASFDAALQVIEDALVPTGYLQGQTWGLADLLVAGMLYALEQFRYNGFTAFPRLRKWLDASYARPAAREAIDLCEVL